MNQLALILSLTLGASLLVAACSSSSVTAPGAKPDGEGGAAGEGGAIQPGGCTRDSDCMSFGDCDSLEDLESYCPSGGDLVRYASRCGGTYVEETGAVTESTWVFDANGQQIGASFEDESTCSYWGSTCGPTGPGTPLCSTECISHNTCREWGANFGCPATLDDLPEYCELGIDIERQPSGCGGTIVDANNGIQHVIWTFDARDRLVAFRSVGDANNCDYWGTECNQPRTGTTETVCDAGGEGGMGGQGGAGGGGAGGAAAAGGSD